MRIFLQHHKTAAATKATKAVVFGMGMAIKPNTKPGVSQE